MQPVIGTVHTIGRITICDNYPQDFHDDLNFYNVDGAFVEMSDEQVRQCSHLLHATVEVWPAHPDGVVGNPPATPEVVAHLMARLSAAEDNLAREVRSNQAAKLVRADLEQRLKNTGDGLVRSFKECDRLAGELADALGEVGRLQALLEINEDAARDAVFVATMSQRHFPDEEVED